MQKKSISYKDAKNLLLQGYPVKLPEWRGYWKMNINIVEAHLEDGNVEEASDVMATFHDNWEIATVDNCPVLKNDIEGKNKKEYDFEIIDMTMINLPLSGNTPMVVIKRESEKRPKVLKLDDFEKLVGSRKEAMIMTKEFAMSRMPEDMRHLMDKVENMLDEIISSVKEKTYKDREEVHDCPLRKRILLDEEELEEFKSFLKEVGVEIVESR